MKNFTKIKTIINQCFTNNLKHDFKVSTVDCIGSVIIRGDVKLIDELLGFIFGQGLGLFADHGYTRKYYPLTGAVVLSNFNLYTNYKWNKIWR